MICNGLTMQKKFLKLLLLMNNKKVEVADPLLLFWRESGVFHSLLTPLYQSSPSRAEILSATNHFI